MISSNSRVSLPEKIRYSISSQTLPDCRLLFVSLARTTSLFDGSRTDIENPPKDEIDKTRSLQTILIPPDAVVIGNRFDTQQKKYYITKKIPLQVFMNNKLGIFSKIFYKECVYSGSCIRRCLLVQDLAFGAHFFQSTRFFY